MSDVDVLKQVFNREKQIHLLTDKIERLKDLRFSITSQLGSDVVSGTRTKSKLEDITLNLIDLENELEAALAGEPFLQLRIRTIIAKLDDSKQREILTSRYIDKKPWQTIAAEHGITKRNAQKIRAEALKELERIGKENEME